MLILRTAEDGKGPIQIRAPIFGYQGTLDNCPQSNGSTTEDSSEARPASGPRPAIYAYQELLNIAEGMEVFSGS